MRRAVGPWSLVVAAATVGRRGGHRAVGPRRGVPSPRSPAVRRPRPPPRSARCAPPRRRRRSSGPATTLPANPTSTVVTPRRGGRLHRHVHRPLRQHGHPAGHLHAVRHRGVARSPCPAGFTGRANEVSATGGRPVRRHLPRLLLRHSWWTSSRPTGTLLWSVDPGGGQPDRDLRRGHRAPTSQWRSAWCRTRRRSDVLDPATGAVTGTFPLCRRRRLRHPRDRRRPPLLRPTATSKTVSPDRHRARPPSAHPTSRATASTPGRGPSSTTRPRPSRAPDGTIYTADPLTPWRPPVPDGILQGTTTLGGALDFGGWGLRPGRLDVLLPERPAVQQRRPTTSPRSPWPPLQTYLGGVQAPVDSPRLGRRPVHAGHRQLLRPRHHPAVTPPSTRGGSRRPPTSSCPTRWRTPPRSTPRPCPPPPSSRSRPRPGRWPSIPLTIPAADDRPGSLRGAGLALLGHLHHPAHHPRHHLHALHRRRHRGRPRLRHPARRHRRRRPGRPPGRGPQRPARAGRPARATCRLGARSCPTATPRPRRRPPVGRRP